MLRATIELVTGVTLLAMTLVASAPLSAADPATVLVEDWSKQPEGKTGIPDGWKGQTWGSPKYEFRIVTQGGRKVLHLKSQNDSSTAGPIPSAKTSVPIPAVPPSAKPIASAAISIPVLAPPILIPSLCEATSISESRGPAPIDAQM